ncbi:MAG TPA: DUF4410 domain-containing protein [Terriglobales bacterium]|nr:DUF4410 domain-containing protein [Terriglobales bacterium]
MRKAILVVLFSCIALFSTFAVSQTANTNDTLKDRYHVLLVENFDIQPGVDLPPDYVAALPQEVVHELKESKKFSEVLAAGENPSDEKTPVLRLTGTITGFDQGSRGKRYLGVGIGAARIFVTLHYFDRASGQVVFEDKVIGTLSGGVFGGDSKGVVRELARTVAVTTKLALLRNPSDPNHVVTAPSSTATEGTTDRQVLAIKASDLSGAQQRLNELAAAGYRLIDFKITGSRGADVTMEKSAVPPQTYQYLLVHALSSGNVQKNMNKGAADGYRLSPHTLAALSGFALIMEKPPTPAQTRYEYRFLRSMRESNAEKNITEAQAEGFVPVETAQILGVYVIIAEKGSTSLESSVH